MRNLLTILLLFSQSLFATTYYISDAGKDTNNGTSQAIAWQTIDKAQGLTLYRIIQKYQTLLSRQVTHP